MISPFASQIISLQGVGISKQGGRPENQDDWAFADTPLGFLLVVCDGMGGGPGGKTASYIAKCELIAAIQACSPQMPRVDALKKAVSKADEALYHKMNEVPELQGMGSTLVAVLLNQQSAVIAHLGDSRCYRISHGKMAFRTEDHSLVGELVRNKALTEEQARVSPQSNVITRGLGNTSNRVPEIDEVPFRTGDRFFLCSDGIWGIMPHAQLLQRLTSMQELSSLVENLSAEVDQIGFSAGGHHDNHTLVAIEMKTNSILKDKMSKKLIIALAALAVLLAVSLIFNIVSFVKLGALQEENKDQKYNMALIQKEKDEERNSLIHQIEELEKDNMSLSEIQEQLKKKVDSLERVIIEKQDTNSQSFKKTTDIFPKVIPSIMSPREITQRFLLNLLKSMEDEDKK